MASAVIDRYRPRGIDGDAIAFARRAVAAVGPAGPARARALLWATSRLAAWGLSVGLAPAPAVLLHPSVVERYVTVGMARASPSARRTARTNLRFVARRVVPTLVQPAPAPLGRGRAKAPYSAAEVAAYFALAAAQPTEARRHRLTALLCVGLGAGIERAELRHLRGHDVSRRGGGVVVAIAGRRARTVPVLARYHEPLLAAAGFAGDGYLCGGESAARKNLTAGLLADIAGGTGLARLEVGRLRDTWLAEHLDRLGVPALLAAAGVSHSQRIFDLAAALHPGDDATMVARLS